jgi:deoxycytidine triphosphate deaminase
VIKILPVRAAHPIHAFAAEGTVIINAMDSIKLGPNEVGIIEGKYRHHKKGWYMQGGMVNPGWEGILTVEIKYSGEIDIKLGEEICQVVVIGDGFKILNETEPEMAQR